MDINKFYNENEQRDFELLKEFNEKLQLNNLKRTNPKCEFDAEGMTFNNKNVAIELKYRDADFNVENNTLYNSDEIIIEAHKYIDMINISKFDNKIPLFINFTKNGYKIVFNLDYLSVKPIKRFAYTKNPSYNSVEKEFKYFLNLKDAFIYDKNNKLVKH